MRFPYLLEIRSQIKQCFTVSYMSTLNLEKAPRRRLRVRVLSRIALEDVPANVDIMGRKNISPHNIIHFGESNEQGEYHKKDNSWDCRSWRNIRSVRILASINAITRASTILPTQFSRMCMGYWYIYYTRVHLRAYLPIHIILNFPQFNFKISYTY